MSHSRRIAFTLIELLVVIIIVAVLAAISVGSLSKMQTSHTRSESITRLKTLARALQVYRDDWGDVPPWDPAAASPELVGPGLWALVQLDYLSTWRYLSDPATPAGAPWVDDGSGGRIEVTPSDPTSMGTIYNLYCGDWGESPVTIGADLTPRQEWIAYCILARVANHTVAGAPLGTAGGRFTNYDPDAGENYCSWMMQDPATGEWKYRPRRSVTANGAGAGETFPAGDPTAPDYYHRQLSHRGTDDDSPTYLPASDAVVTWSTLYRETDQRSWTGTGSWGTDLILYADGHVAIVPGPLTATDWRALVRPSAGL